MKLLRFVLPFLVLWSVAHAATVGVTPGSGTNFLTKTDGSGNNASSITVCDATTPTNCSPVDATKGIKIDLSSYFGTAGSANTNVLTIQGIASMTKILVTPDSVALPANQSVNASQVNGVTTLTGAGATGTGAQRVTAAQDTTTIAGSAPGTAGSASPNVVTVQGIASGTTLPVTQSSVYPAGAVAITASATGTTAATTATLAGTSGKTTYICSYSVRANATAAATVTDTVTGVITATMSSILWVAPLASGLGVDEQIFTPCVPASGTNVGIAVVSGAPGSGGTVSVHAAGYQQ